jgi:hypothetical protein
MAKRVLAGTLVISAMLVLGGCAQQRRSTFDLQTPRVYIWTHFDPAELRTFLQVDGLCVEETGKGGGLFLVSGTGTLRWPAAEITVGTSRIVANGVVMDSRADSYRNLVIEESGRVRPDAFLPFEKRFLYLW